MIGSEIRPNTISLQRGDQINPKKRETISYLASTRCSVDKFLMDSCLNSQSHLPLILRLIERVHSAKIRFRHSINEWVRQHIIDDDPYDTPEWRKLTYPSYYE